MGTSGQRKRAAEPSPGLVERAIVKVLKLANDQGITASDLIQMLDAGMPITDFLNAMDRRETAPCNVDSLIARSTFVRSQDS